MGELCVAGGQQLAELDQPGKLSVDRLQPAAEGLGRLQDPDVGRDDVFRQGVAVEQVKAALVIESGVSERPDGPPGLLLARRFAITAVACYGGVPGEPSGEDDLDLDLADTVQIEMELIFPRDIAVEADDFWTAAGSGEFDAAVLAEAETLTPVPTVPRRAPEPARGRAGVRASTRAHGHHHEPRSDPTRFG